MRAPARGPASLYLSLMSSDGELTDSQRTVPRCTLAIVAIVLYALATPLFWASTAHSKTSRHASKPHATLVSKDHASDSHEANDGGGDGDGPNGNDATADSSAAACPAQPSSNTSGQNGTSNTSGAQATSNTGAKADSNTSAAGATSNSSAGQATSNTSGQKGTSNTSGANGTSNTSGAQASSNTSAGADSSAATSANTSNATAANCPPVVNPPVVNVNPPGPGPSGSVGAVNTPVAGTPVTPAAPGSGAAGVVQRSARATLRAQTRCAASSARVSMAVRQVRRVTFSVNGRRVRTVNVAANARTVSAVLPLRATGPRRQTVTARVTFRNGSAPRTLRVRVTRCAAVRPQFTG